MRRLHLLGTSCMVWIPARGSGRNVVTALCRITRWYRTHVSLLFFSKISQYTRTKARHPLDKLLIMYLKNVKLARLLK
jgi:hypothetical protein